MCPDAERSKGGRSKYAKAMDGRVRHHEDCRRCQDVGKNVQISERSSMLKNKPRKTESAVDEPRLLADDLANLRRQIRLYVASCVDGRLDVEDIVQEVLLRLLKARHCRDTKSYAFTVAKNLVSQYLYKRAKMLRTISHDLLGDPLCHYDANLARDPSASPQDLTGAIANVEARLPARAVEALQLRFMEGLSVKQAARKADLTPNYVPHPIRGLSTSSLLFGEGAGPAEAGAEAKQAAAKAAGAL